MIDGAAYSDGEIARLAARIREHRASVVLALDELEIDQQMRCAATFLNALFDAPREQWHPALVVVDEAQMFAPAAAGDVSEDARRVSLAAMTNLMCRGRKRGLAGVIATQRLAKLAKNVAAEASNFLMGRTFLDIDMQRAADLLGMERRQAEAIRDLERGRFLGLGPAIARRPVSVRIGGVRTGPRGPARDMAPPPEVSAQDLHALLHTDLRAEPAPAPRPAPPRADPEALIRRVVNSHPLPSASKAKPVPSSADPGTIHAILCEMAADEAATFQSMMVLQQDFAGRCRMRGVSPACLDAVQFRHGFALAVAGIDDPGEERWIAMLELARQVHDEALAPFFLIARHAIEGRAAPDDDALARAYGSSSPRRVQRLLDHLEREGLIVVHTSFAGGRSIVVPALGAAVAAGA